MISQSIPQILLTNISLKFKSFIVISKISYPVKLNWINSIVGPSGCGKTTLLLVLAGLITPNSGTRSLDSNLKESDIVYIPQQDALLPWRSLRENIGLGLELLTEKDISNCEIVEWAEHFNAAKFLDKRPHELSGGMRKRICLARAFCANPKVVLLDEPFNNLDFRDHHRLENFLRKWVTKEDRAVVCITHDIEQAVAIGDSIGCFTKNLKASKDDKMQFEVFPIPENLRNHTPPERRAHPEFHKFVETIEQLFADE